MNDFCCVIAQAVFMFRCTFGSSRKNCFIPPSSSYYSILLNLSELMMTIRGEILIYNGCLTNYEFFLGLVKPVQKLRRILHFNKIFFKLKTNLLGLKLGKLNIETYLADVGFIISFSSVYF